MACSICETEDGFVIQYGNRKSFPQPVGIAKALQNDLNNNPSYLTYFMFNVCCKQSFINEPDLPPNI